MRRQGIKRHERVTVRKWYSDQRLRLTQMDCISCLTNQYHRQLRQATVSVSLSDHFQYLDVPTSRRYPNACAHHNGLYLNKSHSSGNKPDILLVKATKISPRLNFPLGGYKSSKCVIASQNKCAKVKQEACLISQLNRRRLYRLSAVCDKEDIYNMDQKGLFCKWPISARLGTKKDESGISVVVCTNATDNDRLPL
ncbi:unnamed protein product [Blumeria hordei]|uniref:ARS-binding protein 1 N-terminal domain-containing protein n=2 Tax=Blumeria hordei TaxID=2867405 RepID=A0A383URU7_BLUHO|nr:hypothetical protein BGHDH14_bgh04861 [Blumeria hordei DH14]SZF02496.1 unnamed protein product [Blumeria hordei]